MTHIFRAEWSKARHRHDLLTCILLPLTVLLWVGYSAPDGAADRTVGFHALFYTLPVINTVLLPVGMAMLATRLWDVEVKGSFPKLLYTLQSRRSLFVAKALFGMAEVLFVVMLETIGAIGLGFANGFQDFPPFLQILYWFICTVAVGLMLFFSELLLTILIENPLPALCVGITGSLVGLFSAFMPPIVSYFIPWSYCIPLGTYILADWDPDTDVVIYGIRAFNFPLLLWCILLTCLFFSCTWHAIRNKEV